MFSDVVWSCPKAFEEIIDAKKRKGGKLDTELEPRSEGPGVRSRIFLPGQKRKGETPQDPHVQLNGAVKPFPLRDNPRATSTAHERVRLRLGHAVNVQSMGFGNSGDSSAPVWPSPAIPPPREGPVWRIPHQAQGEECGRRGTPSPISKLHERCRGLRPDCPIANKLEQHYMDIQDWILHRERQALYAPEPIGKRTAAAP